MVKAAVLVWLFFGLGGAATSPGVVTLANQLRQIPGVTVQGVYSYESWRSVAAAVKLAPRSAKKVLIGYSCGVGATEWAAATASVPVDELVGIQGSVFCPPYALPGNVLNALEIYNPNCGETLGLGCAVYQRGPRFRGHIKLITRDLSHGAADLDPITHTDILNAVKALVPPAGHADKIGLCFVLECPT